MYELIASFFYSFWRVHYKGGWGVIFLLGRRKTLSSDHLTSVIRVMNIRVDFLSWSPPQWSALYYLTKKNLRNKVRIPFPWVFLGIKDVNGKATRRKREQKVWLDRSKQVYHLDDDQHQQNQSRIQALLLSISRAFRLWGLWWTINKTWHFLKTSTSSRMLTRIKNICLNIFG